MDWLRRIILRVIDACEALARLFETLAELPVALALAFAIWLYWPELTKRREEDDHGRGSTGA